MPSMADITVKKNDGTTDIVYTAMSPSAGDNVPAWWRSNTISAPPGLKPDFRLTAKWNGPRTVRRMDYIGVYPSVVTDSTTTLQSAPSKIIFSGNVSVPQTNVTQSDIDEAVSQFANFLKSSLVLACLKAGISAT